MCLKVKSIRYIQYISAVTACLAVASSSMCATWPSPSLIKLQSENSPVGEKISDEEGSWIVSVFLIGTIPAPLIAWPMIETVGRKKTLLFGGVLLLTSWLMIIFANGIIWLYIGRFIAGVGTNISTVGCTIYNSEIAEKDIRGKLGIILSALSLLGTLIVLCVGPYASYTALSIVCASLPMLFLLMFSFMPESPYYLVKVHDRDNAEKVLRTLSNKPIDNKSIQDKLLEIDYTVQKDMENKTTAWELFSSRCYRKALIIMIGVKTLQHFSGTSVMEAYMQTIIELTGSNISSELSSLIFGLIQLPAVLAATFLVDGIGRKPLLIYSALGSGIALASEGIYFYLQDIQKIDISNLAWLPTTSLGLFLVMSNLGIATIPYVLLGELFPTNIKGIAVSVMSLYGGLTAFLASKFFMPLSNVWGTHVVLWMFTAVCILGSIFVYVFLPETRGRTFVEIQDVLQKRKRDEHPIQTNYTIKYIDGEI